MREVCVTECASVYLAVSVCVCVCLCNAKPGELEVLMTAHLAGRRRWQTWKCKHELTHMSLSVCARMFVCAYAGVCVCVLMCVW